MCDPSGIYIESLCQFVLWWPYLLAGFSSALNWLFKTFGFVLVTGLLAAIVVAIHNSFSRRTWAMKNFVEDKMGRSSTIILTGLISLLLFIFLIFINSMLSANPALMAYATLKSSFTPEGTALTQDSGDPNNLTQTPPAEGQNSQLEPVEYCSETTPPPCLYINDQFGDGAMEIAVNVYGEKNISFARLIANLHRDSRGRILRFDYNQTVIVPALDPDVDLSYMEYYMNDYYGYDFGECVRGSEETYLFPCVYISNGETYQSMVEEFYSAYGQFSTETKIDFLKRANRLEYVTSLNGAAINDLHPISSFASGDVVILPAIP